MAAGPETRRSEHPRATLRLVPLAHRPITAMLEEDAYMSDLTEDEGEGDDKSTQTRSPTKKKTRARKNDPSEYRIQGALTAYRATTYNAQHLFGLC